MDFFYQKYRPQILDDLDSAEARKVLTKIVESGKLPRALLFAGPKGIGKTSAARVLAKIINCPKRKGVEPCNRCDICLEITNGTSLDVLEIDAASNRGIDDIRQLKEKIDLQPIKAKNKIYIIDEVHMLTREAFNAILKTLEEPPPHVYFIFCTTNPEKIPETVLSRLTRIDFRRANKEEVARALNRVIKGEKIKLDKDVLEVIAQMADGSYRDAHKILYQLWLAGGGKITKAEAAKVLERWRENSPWYLLELIFKSKLKESILLLEGLAQRGLDWQDYGRRLAEALNGLLLMHVGGIKAEKKSAENLAPYLSRQKILLLGELLQRAMVEIKDSSLPQLPFQLAVVDYFEREDLRDSGIVDNGGVDLDKPSQPLEKKPVRKVEAKKIAPVARDNPNLAALKEKWPEFLEAVKPMNHSVGALLRACRPRDVQSGYLILDVFYQFHKDQLEQERNRRILEEALKQVFQRSLRVKCKLSPKPVSSPSPALKRDDKEQTAKTGSGDDLYEIAKEIFGE